MAKKSTQELQDIWNKFDRPREGTVFQHYKGGLYEIVSTGFNEDTLEPCVIYRSTEEHIVWVRNAENFFEKIVYEGVELARFRLV